MAQGWCQLNGAAPWQDLSRRVEGGTVNKAGVGRVAGRCISPCLFYVPSSFFLWKKNRAITSDSMGNVSLDGEGGSTPSSTPSVSKMAGTETWRCDNRLILLNSLIFFNRSPPLLDNEMVFSFCCFPSEKDKDPVEEMGGK